MKIKLYILCFMLLISSRVYTQTTFTHTWFTGGQNAFGSFYELPDSSFILQASRFPNGGSIHAIIMRCNQNGDSLYTFSYDNSANGPMVLLNDSEIITTDINLAPWFTHLTKINFVSGDTSLLKIYPCAYSTAALHHCADGGYIMLNFDAFSYSYIKTDANYNIIWHKPDNMSYGASQIKPDPLGGYVAVGNLGYVSNPYGVQRLDSAGNIIWFYGYGNVPVSAFDDIYDASDVVIADDSNYIVACVGDFMSFMKINRLNGDTIWTKILSGWSPHIINNAGNDTYITVTDSFALIDGNGDFVWKTPIVPNGFNVYHCAKTLDGGYAFCGSMNNNSVMVFVKLDSLGNTVNTSIFDIEKQKQVYFYPNPASDVLNFAHSTSSNFTFSVCNLFGNKVSFVTNKTSIDVSALTPGIYVAEVREGEKVTREKFVKQ